MEKGPERRLQSLKLPRDLTLGGAKPKKTFTPNLNVARNKEKSRDFFVKSEDKRKHNHRRDGRNNKRPVQRSERFVQSSGIFSDGVGNDILKKIRYERYSNSSKDEPTKNVVPVPKIKKDDWQVDTKSEAKVYDNIMADNSTLEEEGFYSFSPVSWNENDLKDRKVFTSSKLKSEAANSLELDKIKLEIEKIPKPFDETDQFSDYNPGLTLWKLPDSFAGKGLSDDPNVHTFTDYNISEMLEGQIGKMRIRKSGKVEVYIGCMKYAIEQSKLESFSEKVVAVDDKNPETNSIVLGEVQNRYILNPDWSFLLKDS